MKHLKRYNESNEEDIFSDESLLRDILSEYVECNITYALRAKAFKLWDGENFMPIGSDRVYFNGEIFNDPLIYKGYQVSFSEFFNNGYRFNNGYCAVDVQRGENQKVFGVPKNNLYRFFEITKEIQYRIESMGYIFLLSTHKNGKLDFMIIENK